jgi:hypothetical protein
LSKIILHVGTHKTGTTSFQSSMEENAEALIAQGIRPIFGTVYKNNRATLRTRANHMHFAHLLLRPEVLTGARFRRTVPMMSDEERLQELERFSQEVANFKEETILISCEVLCLLRTEEEQFLLQKFLTNVGREVSTLIAFRNDIEWRESWINQLKKDKNGLFEKVSSENIDVSIVGPWYFEKSAIRAFWSAFNLTEIDFNSHSNIVKALYDEMRIGSQTIETDFFKNLRA